LTLGSCSPSALRNNLQGSLADPKYDGVRVTRNQLDDDNGEDGEITTSDEVFPTIDSGVKDRPVTSEDESDNSEAEIEQDGHPEHTPRPRQASESVVNGNKSGNPAVPIEKDVISTTLKQARDEERKKGKTVVRQLVSTFVLPLVL
jgi:protein AATF/BFR2